MDKNDLYAILENQYFGPEMHEKQEIERLPELLKDVRVFVDVGSSLGQYAYFANRILSNAEIYCIEPDPFKVARLKELIRKWEPDGSNTIYVIQKALSDSPGIARFFVPVTHRTSGAFFRIYEGQWEEVEVEVDTLDNLFRNKHVDFIKIDVEGAELRVLRGAQRLLQSQNMRVFLEIAPWGDPERGYRPSEVFRFMAKFGYTFRLVERHFLFYRSPNRILVGLKAHVAGLVVDRPWLKRPVKRLLTWVQRMRSGNR